MTNKRSVAPVVLFVYNRLDHTRQTVEALQQNELALESSLIVFSDAAKTDAGKEKINEIRDYIRQIDGFKSVTVVEREKNLGLAKSIIDGVSTVVNTYGRVIVLEDDLVTSPYFLTYMNEALEKYADDDRVISIHGYVYPVTEALPEAFFLLGADCWGWATWRRGWKLFNPDGRYLLDELQRRKLTRAFDFNGTFPFSKMLKDQIKGNNNSWAIRWHASAFLAGRMTLHPGRSLVHNIGNDSSGTHCDDSSQYDTQLSELRVNLDDIEIKPSEVGLYAFEKFYRQHSGALWWRFVRRAVSIIRTCIR